MTDTAVERLVALQAFFAKTVKLMLLFFQQATQAGNFLLHLLQLHIQLALG